MPHRPRVPLVLVALAVTAVLSSCQSGPGIAMWGPCATVGGDHTGTDGNYAMFCENGRWVPIMTANEFVRISRGEPGVVIAPLPPQPVPQISSVSPAIGPTAGGTSVTITGSGFTGTVSVTFGGNPATSVTVVNDNTVTATNPAGPIGSAHIVVTSSYGTATHLAAFTYGSAPTISYVTPPVGPTLGQVPASIIGTGFLGATSATIGWLPVDDLTVVNDTRIDVLTPAFGDHTGLVDVTVTTPHGTGTLVGGFTNL